MNGLYSLQPHRLLQGNPDGRMCKEFIRATVCRTGEPLYTSPPASMSSVDLLVTMDRLVNSRSPGRSLKATLQSKPAKSVALVCVCVCVWEIGEERDGETRRHESLTITSYADVWSHKDSCVPSLCHESPQSLKTEEQQTFLFSACFCSDFSAFTPTSVFTCWKTLLFYVRHC